MKLIRNNEATLLFIPHDFGEALICLLLLGHALVMPVVVETRTYADNAWQLLHRTSFSAIVRSDRNKQSPLTKKDPMKKLLLLIISLLPIMLYGMEPKSKKRGKDVGVIAQYEIPQVSEEHYLPPEMEKVMKLGSWESTLANKFKKVTPAAMLHFRAIQKIIDYLKCDTGKPLKIHGHLTPGLAQTEQGLKIQIWPHSLILCTPWGELDIKGGNQSSNGIDLGYQNYLKENPNRQKYDNNSPSMNWRWIPQFYMPYHPIFKHVSAILTKREVDYDSFENPSFYEYNVLAVDSEKLPWPVHGLTSRELLKFIPKVWANMENAYRMDLTDSVGQIESFLKIGANMNEANHFGYPSPLYFAIEQGCTEIVELFLRWGAAVNVQDNAKRTPLHLTIIHNSKKEIVKLLLKYGAEVNAQDHEGHTPLHLSVIHWNEEIIELLLKQPRIDVNLQDAKGFTPLQLAQERKNEKSVNLIQNWLSSVDQIKSFFKTSEPNCTEIVELLLKWGNVRDQWLAKHTPLHLAIVHSGKEEIVKLLLKYEAEVNARTDISSTPQKKKEIVKALLIRDLFRMCC